MNSSCHFLASLNLRWEPLRQTIYHYQCSGQSYGGRPSWCNPSHVPQARRVFPCILATVSFCRQCIPQLLFQIERQGLTSSSVRTVEDLNEYCPLTRCFSYNSYRIGIHLSHGGGSHVVTSLLQRSYWACVACMLADKWRPINLSVVCMLISPLCLVNMYRNKRMLKWKWSKEG